MADFINTVDIVGDDALTDSLIDRSITEFHDNLITEIGDHAFAGCATLTSIKLPNITSVSTYAFSNCQALTNIDLFNITNISNGAFYNCVMLTTVILRASTICTLTDKGAFSNTPFTPGRTGGTVYVPQALITEYQNATNWSTLYAGGTCNFVAIEGSEYE